MGIPYFFRDIVTKHRSILTHIQGCDRLFLDYNSIIHTCSAHVMSTTTHFKSEEEKLEKIMKAILDYTYQVVAACPPSRLLYIAIDGVAPLAKISQQRKRRHMSAYRNTSIAEFKTKNKIPYSDWDSNCITPGTQFMEKLDTYLRHHFRHASLPYNVIVSGPTEDGEGEHKIIQYMKDPSHQQGDIDFQSYRDVIYGLDADLMMLTLTCNKQNIYLMRESQQFGSKPSGPAISSIPTFKYVNIDELRTYVSKHLYHIEDTQYMYDYVFICFLLGNDFLPHPPFLSIKHGGVDVLCEAYREVHKELGTYCLLKQDDGRYVVCTQFLQKLLHILAKKEDEMVKHIVNTYYETPYFDRPHQNALERHIQEIDNMPMKCRNKFLDPDNDPLWRNSYYYHLLRINPYTDMKQVDEICSSFLEGLQWNADYYLNGIYSHKWFFPYPFSPPMQDLYKYLAKGGSIQDPVKKDPIHISPEEQLLLVLPVHSKHLVKPEFRKVYDDPRLGCMHFYPRTFKIETFLKSQLWECTPILPTMNIPYLKQKISTLRLQHPTL